MRAEQKSRSSVRLTESLENSLTRYVLAGLGTVVLVPAVNAQVIYTQANVTFDVGAVKMDFDHDGTPDLALNNHTSRYNGIYYNILGIVGKGKPGAGVIAKVSYAQALAYGASIGPNLSFTALSHRKDVPLEAFTCFYENCANYRGNWLNVRDRFLGVQIQLNGQLHYGWVRLTVQRIRKLPFFIDVTLKDYAYESTPNKAITAGDRGPDLTSEIQQEKRESISAARPPVDASLGLLSAGADAIPLWRGQR